MFGSNSFESSRQNINPTYCKFTSLLRSLTPYFASSTISCRCPTCLSNLQLLILFSRRYFPLHLEVISNLTLNKRSLHTLVHLILLDQMHLISPSLLQVARLCTAWTPYSSRRGDICSHRHSQRCDYDRTWCKRSPMNSCPLCADSETSSITPGGDAKLSNIRRNILFSKWNSFRVKFAIDSPLDKQKGLPALSLVDSHYHLCDN